MSRDHLEIRLESTDFSTDHVQIHRLSGREAISAPFAFEIDVACERGDEVDVGAMEGADASLVFDRGGEIVRRVHGMIAGVDDRLETEVDHRTLRLHLVPRVHRLSLVETQEVFVGKSVPEIIVAKLERVGLSAGEDFELRLRREHPARELVVQYQETDLAFVSRLAEHLGISFHFDHEGDRDKIVFTDHAGGFLPVPGRERITFHGRGARQDVYRIEARTRAIPRSYVMQDYNYRTPLVDLSGSAEAPSGIGGGVVEFGAHVKTPADAERMAAVRAEEREARHKVFHGESALPELLAGGTFTLEDHKHLDGQRLLVVEIEHHATQAVGMHGGQGDRAYHAAFQAVDAALEYRPPRRTPRPRIDGVVTAIVEPMSHGDQSRFAKVDDQGRYTLRFLFDNAEHGHHRPSHPIRMIQPHAGQGYGMHFPLKPGVEVLVAFLGGDPDRPLIVGAAPNPVTPSPVTGKNQMIHRVSTETGIVLTMKDA